MSAKDDATDDDPTEDQPGDDEPTEEPATETAASDDDHETSEEAETTDEPEESAEPAEPEPAAAATTKAGTAATLESARAWVTTAPVWKVGGVAVLVAGIAAEIFGRLGQAAGAEMKAPQSFGGDKAESIFIGGFIFATVIYGVIGILLAMLLAWKAKKPAMLWGIITVILTVLTFASPIMAENTTTPTKWVLALSHVVAAVIIIPTVYLRLSELERSKATQPEPA